MHYVVFCLSALSQFICELLFFVFSVHTDCHRTIVEQFYLHIGTELTGLYRFAECFRQFFAEFLIQRYRDGVGAARSQLGRLPFL